GSDASAPQADRAGEREGQRDGDDGSRGQADGASRSSRRSVCRRQVAGTATWVAGRREGPARDGRNPDDVRFATAQRLCAGLRLPGDTEGEGGRRDHHRKDECAGVWTRVAIVQPGVWSDAESL